MGHQGAQAVPEGEGGHHQDHGEDGTQEGRAHRHRGPTPARIEGEADPELGRRRYPGRGQGLHGPRRGGCAGAAPLGDSMGQSPPGQQQGGGTEHDDQHRHPRPEHRPVDGEPRVGVDRSNRPERGQRREDHRHRGGHQRPDHERGRHADQTVTQQSGPIGPDGPEDGQVRGGAAQQAGDQLDGDEERGQQGHAPEDAEGDDQRPDGPFHLDLDGSGVVEAVGVVRWGHRRELPFRGGHSLVAAIEPESVGDGTLRPLSGIVHDGASHGRSEELEGGIAVDVVLDDGVAHLHQPDERGGEPAVGWDRRCPEAGLALFRLVVEAVVDDLAHVDAHQVGGQGRHLHLIGPPWIGQVSSHQGQPVLVEKEPVHAGDGLDVVDAGEFGCAVPAERCGGDGDGGLDLPDAGQSGDAIDGRGGVGRRRTSTVADPAEDGDTQVGGVGAGQVGGERGLGPTGRRHRTEAQPSHQADQEDQRQVAAPPLPEGGPEPVDGHG